MTGTRNDVLELLPDETFPAFFERVGSCMVKKPASDALYMTSRSLLTIALSYNNLKNKANVPLEKATFMKWIREINWLGAGTPAQELSDEELDQRLKYAYTYRLAGKPSGIIDMPTAVKYAAGRGAFCGECFTGYAETDTGGMQKLAPPHAVKFERNRRCGHSTLPILHVCALDTCGAAYHSCCLKEPEEEEHVRKRDSRNTWLCPTHAESLAATAKMSLPPQAPPNMPDNKLRFNSNPPRPQPAFRMPQPSMRSMPHAGPYGHSSNPYATPPRPPHLYARNLSLDNSHLYPSPQSSLGYGPGTNGAAGPGFVASSQKRQRLERERARSWSEPEWQAMSNNRSASPMFLRTPSQQDENGLALKGKPRPRLASAATKTEPQIYRPWLPTPMQSNSNSVEMDSGAEGNQSLLLLAEMACRQAPIRGREKLERVEEYPDLPFNYDQSYVDGTADAMATPPETDNSLDSKSEDEIAYNQTANNRQPTLEEKQLMV